MSQELVKVEEKEQAITTSGAQLLDVARALRIKTPADYTRAGEMLRKQAKPLIEAIKELFRPMKESAWKNHRTICGREHTLLDSAVEAIDLIKDKMLEYETRETQRAAEKQAALNEKGGAPATVEPRIPDVEGVVHITEWYAEVVDANLVPREWCDPNVDRINAYVGQVGAAAVGRIPGVKVAQRTRIAVRKEKL